MTWAGPTTLNSGSGAVSATSQSFTPSNFVAGTLVVIVLGFQNGVSVTGLTVADTAGNTWGVRTQLNPATVNGMVAVIWCVANASGSSTVTVTRTGTTNLLAFQWVAQYFTGNKVTSPEDTAVFTGANGTSASPGCTGNAATQAGDLLIAATEIMLTAGQTYTEDAGHGWNVFGNTGGSTSGMVAAGYQVNAGSGAVIYAPTASVGTKKWCSLQVGFSPASSSSFVLTQKTWAWSAQVLSLNAKTQKIMTQVGWNWNKQLLNLNSKHFFILTQKTWAWNKQLLNSNLKHFFVLTQKTWAWNKNLLTKNAKTFKTLTLVAWNWNKNVMSRNAKTMIVLKQRTWLWAGNAFTGFQAATKAFLQLMGLGS